MSFRARLTLFFVLIVVVPMVALAVVVARVVSTSEQAKATAQNHASAAAALALFHASAQDGARAARALAHDPALVAALRTPATADDRIAARTLAADRALARVRISQAGRTLLDIGDPRAIAPGAVRVTLSTAAPITLEAATGTAARFARTVSTHGVRAVLTRDRALLASTLPAGWRPSDRFPAHGTVTRDGTQYTVATFTARDFANRTTTVAILTDTRAAASAATRGKTIAIGLLAAFLLLAFGGALLISRQLHGQLARFLVAAKRIGRGDLSAAVPVEGDDEFGQLAREFNKMAVELDRRMRELDQERGRLRESIQRIGATFAANLDRVALLEIGTQTIVDAVQAQCGRAALRTSGAEAGALLEITRLGDLHGAEQAIAAAEAAAYTSRDPRDDRRPLADSAADGDAYALAAPIPRQRDGAPLTQPRGVISVARRSRPFTDAERELVASLARQAGLSLENVDLHEQVQRQAVTDELTGLSNRARFEQVIAAEAASARRFDQPLGLLMLDIDNFKRVNDTYGHQQGDLVLREVAAALRACSREVDEPARYGGEELVVALQQTDLAGAEAIAERVRGAVEALALPRLDGQGAIRVTVSCGVAASADGDPVALVAAADAALYIAKRSGKNRTVRAEAPVTAGGAG